MLDQNFYSCLLLCQCRQRISYWVKFKWQVVVACRVPIRSLSACIQGSLKHGCRPDGYLRIKAQSPRSYFSQLLSCPVHYTPADRLHITYSAEFCFNMSKFYWRFLNPRCMRRPLSILLFKAQSKGNWIFLVVEGGRFPAGGMASMRAITPAFFCPAR